jgi:hypothetical protein
LTAETEPMPIPTLVWVTVAGVQHSPPRWMYRLTEGNRASLNDSTIGLTDRLCCSYLELFHWLCLYGFTPPPPEYFAPTFRELDQRAESILRPVMRRIR